MELLVVLILGTPIIVGLWLIASAINAKGRIEELNRRVDDLQAELIRLRRDQTKPAEPAAAPAPATPPQPAPTAAPVPAPIMPVAEAAPEFGPPPVIPPESEILPPLSETPPPIPPIVTPPPVPPLAQPEPMAEAAQSTEPQPTPPLTPPLTPSPAAKKDSLEMRLGMFWSVRVGIVIILTGIVFFANLAYHHIIANLGAAGKISLLYLASGLLLGAGAWWHRQNVKESMKNFAQVLFAGGLAAVYFTTYAAHHIPPLRVIESALVDGTLLLVWAGVIAFIADRWKSEVLALFAVGLAFYSSVITRVGEFTLYSNLVLTIAAVVFLVRNRWAALSFASLGTTYAGYTFWRFLGEDGWHWAAAEDNNLWFGAGFLASYWLVFTAATFLSRNDKLTGANRAAFLTLNNGAFFSLFLLTMLQVHTHGFWKFAIIYGSALVALSVAAQKFLATEPLARNAYLTQGILLVTVGFISKFAGLQLAIILGAESVLLYFAGTQRPSRVLRYFSYLVAALATGWCVANLNRFETKSLWTGAGLGAMLIANAMWAQRMDAGKSTSLLRAVPTWFTVLAFANWLGATWYNTTDEHLPLVLAAEAAALTFSIYVLRLREVTLLGQLFLVLSQAAWLFQFLDKTPPWWNPLAVIAITIGLSHWWQHQKVLTIHRNFFVSYSTIFALAAVAVALIWLHPLVAAPTWLALTSLLAVAVTAYGLITRAWPLAVCGQIFLAVGAVEFFRQLFFAKPEWYFPLAPLGALMLLSVATLAWFARKPDSPAAVREPLLQVALGYRWIALAMSLDWIWEYVPEQQRVWAYMAAALAVFALAFWRSNVEALVAATAYAIISLAVLWVQNGVVMDVYLPNLLALLALLAMQQVVRRSAGQLRLPENVHGAVIAIAGGTLWRFLCCWVPTSDLNLTMSWAGFAVVFFVAGMGLRERFYRWFGLVVLAAAVGRVVLVDVWREETITRVLTFMALGVALVLVGFIYNKFQETIRKWL